MKNTFNDIATKNSNTKVHKPKTNPPKTPRVDLSSKSLRMELIKEDGYMIREQMPNKVKINKSLNDERSPITITITLNFKTKSKEE